MTGESYERLAVALDELPSGGYPTTPSGAGIRMLKRVFTEEEAELAGQMSRKPETVSELVAKVGWPGEKVEEVLSGCLAKGLVVKRAVDDEPHFRLAPFLGIWYERIMLDQTRHDVKFAGLFEEYMAEAGGKILSPRPGGTRVVPVRGALKPELLEDQDDIDAHFARHERFRVIDCICQIEHGLVDETCSLPLRRCGFTPLPPETPLSYDVLDREHAIELFTQLEDEDTVHAAFYGAARGTRTPQFVGCCNCCGDCCAMLRGINEWGAEDGPQRSNYRAVLRSELCLACGDCVERCQVHAISQDEAGVAEIDRDRCIGCGLCVVKCSGEAIELVPVTAEEWFDPPISFEDFEERRLQNRR